MGYIEAIYTKEQTSPTMTDRYHFSTGYGYLLEGRADNPSIFYMYGRKEAQNGSYTVAAGLEGVVDVAKRWKNHGLTPEDLSYLETQGFPQDWVDYLRTAKFIMQIDAAPEGTLFFPQEPIIRIKGPIAQIKALESLGLCLMNGQCAYATHGARMSYVLEMDVESGAPKGMASVQGLRRGPGLGAAIEASRGLVLGGYKSTSTGRAAEMFGIKFAGTMDHAWVQSHEHQLAKITMKELFTMAKEGRVKELQDALSQDAFRSYAFSNHNNGIFLTDTYDTVQGIDDAITVIKELRALGRELNVPLGQNYGLRFDSGDIVDFSKKMLRRLAERSENGDLLSALPPGVNVSALTHKELLAYAALSDNAPFGAASDGIDEFTALEMRRQGAYIKSWGVGTAGSHVPPVGLVQKLSSMYMKPLNGEPMPAGEKMSPTMKIVSVSPAKSSNPGNINSRRFYDEQGNLSHIVIYDEDLGLDPLKRITNMRDFSETKTNAWKGRSEDILVPVFDAQGRYVYKEPPKKPSFPGSSFMVTDLENIAAQIRRQILCLPESVRQVERPRDDILKDLLLSSYKKSRKDGALSLIFEIAAAEKNLPPEQGRIPVYFDALMLDQRRTCEQKHLSSKKGAEAVVAYQERFEHKGLSV